METDGKSHRDHAGVVVPPPLIFVGTLVLGVLLDLFVAGLSTSVDSTPRYGLAILTIGVGVTLMATALGLFQKSGTRPEHGGRPRLS